MKQIKYTTETFIEKACNIHNNKFTYKNAIYTGSLNKIIITCPIHGDFLQTASSHLQEHGCKWCQIDKKRLNKDIFIERAKLIHGDKYDYTNSIYIGTEDKINIKCPKHGEFYQRISDHLNGRGCNMCGGTYKKSTTEFIRKAKIVHKNKYDYTKTIYTGVRKNLEIICPEHGSFWQEPNNHLSGANCPSCAYKKNQLHHNTRKLIYKENFIARAREIHKNNYEYDLSSWKNSTSKIKIHCNICGNDFIQKPFTHLQGQGCPKHNGGFSRSQWINNCKHRHKTEALVYIINLFNDKEDFIKIGITSNSVRNRFIYNFPYSYEVLKEIKGSPDFIWDKEKELHKLCKEFKYIPEIYFNGQTECFNKECLSVLNQI